MGGSFKTSAAVIFLSTPSARRATTSPRARSSSPAYFYPRPPRGGRRYTSASHWRDIDISIHALREEGDSLPHINARPRRAFLSTPSARRATGIPENQYRSAADFYPRPPRGGRLPRTIINRPLRSISIHALREEGDWRASPTSATFGNFYPRPPRGGRLYVSALPA